MEQNKEHEGLINTAILKGAEKLGVTLKDKQYESIKHFCRGKDVFVSLPTGYGKSIIYVILPLVFNHIRGIIKIPWACFVYYFII